MLPVQHSAEASTDAISERRASMDSVRTEDSCESNLGDSYEHLQRHSPTSLLPEHPFSPPVLKVCLAVASPLGLTSTRLARIQLQQVAALFYHYTVDSDCDHTPGLPKLCDYQEIRGDVSSMPERCAVMIRVHCVRVSATKHRGVFLKHLCLWCALSISCQLAHQLVQTARPFLLTPKAML